MVTFEQIKEANKVIKTVDVKGKDYAEVNQRVKAFRMVYPEGTIETEMVSNADGVCVFKATVKDTEVVLATGYAYEKEGSTYINKTSYIENCETSAVGRALGFCGFGIDVSIASAEEVKNAINNQKDAKATPTQIALLGKVYSGDNLKKLLDANGIDKLEELPMVKASEIINKLKGVNK